MDTNILLRLNDAFKDLKSQLLLDSDIRKLLFYDNDTPLQQQDPGINNVVDYIFTQPVVDIDIQPPFNKKNYITITAPDNGISANNSNVMQYVIRIQVMCHSTCWNIKDGTKPLLIASRVLKILDNYKTTFAGKLYFTDIVETITNKNVSGYSLLFSASEGVGDIGC